MPMASVAAIRLFGDMVGKAIRWAGRGAGICSFLESAAYALILKASELHGILKKDTPSLAVYGSLNVNQNQPCNVRRAKLVWRLAGKGSREKRRSKNQREPISGLSRRHLITAHGLLELCKTNSKQRELVNKTIS